MKYNAKKDVVIAGTSARGETVGPISFAKGTVTAKNDDEVALLDECATDPNNPVGFDQKEE